MDDANDETLIDWSVRLDRVRKENQLLFEFVYGGEMTGTVSKEASRAFFRASVSAMARAGIVEPSMRGEKLGDSLMCTVVAQALHEARLALLAIQPDLRESLEREVPSTQSGRQPPRL